MHAKTEIDNNIAVNQKAISNWADNAKLVTALEQTLCLYSEMAGQLCTDFALHPKHSNKEALKSIPDQYRLGEIFLQINPEAVVKSCFFIVPNLSLKRGKIEIFTRDKRTGRLKQVPLKKLLNRSNASAPLLPVMKKESLTLSEINCLSENNEEVTLSAIPLYFVQLDNLDSLAQINEEKIKDEIQQKVLQNSDITGEKNDHRRHQRFEVNCKLVLSGIDMTTTITKTIDISNGGMQVDTSNIMIPVTGSELNAVLYRPNRKPDNLKVRVVHMGNDTAGLMIIK